MKLTLPILLFIAFLVFLPIKVSARDLNEVGKELENLNQTEMPYGVLIQEANIQLTPSPGTTIAQVKSGEDTVKNYMIKEGNVRNYEEKTQVDTNIFASFLRGLGSLLQSIGDLFNFGNQKAVNVIGTMAPCGVADKALGADNPNCKDGKIISYDGESVQRALETETKVLGLTNTGPMEKGLDLGYCAFMPYGTGDCLKNNTPFFNVSNSSVSMTPTPIANKIMPAISATPVLAQPTSGIFPPGSIFPASINGDLACANKLPSSKLMEIIKSAAKWKGIPPSVLASYACVEGGGLWNLTDDQIDKISQEGEKYDRNCLPNECGAAGPLQMTVGVDGNNDPKCPACPGAVRLGSCPNQWSEFGTASKDALGRSNVNVCNISDALFAAAKKIDHDRLTIESCKQTGGDWRSENLISCVTKAYYGECKKCEEENTYACDRFNKAFGKSMNYCQFVVQFARQWDTAF